VLFLSFAFSSFVQAQDKKYTDSALNEYVDACRCVVKSPGYSNHNEDRFKALKGIRRHHEVFRAADKILYISFINRDNQYPVSYLKAGKLNMDNVIEAKELNAKQIDSLMFAMYANRFAGNPLKILVFECKRPVNAIVFLNKAGRVFTALNIDFNGTAYHIWKADDLDQKYSISFGDSCFGKYDSIKSLFQSAGIKNFNK
jgi:hypothetical protein